MARRIPLLAVVWFTATLFFLGDLGKYSDDYFFSSHDPASGAATAVALWPFPFSRPLHWIVLNGVARALWLHDRAYHLVSALAHGLVAALLVALLLALGASAAAATAATALFLAYPATYEVALWPAALPVALATSLFLVVCLATVRHARRAPHERPRRARGRLLAIALLSLAIPCFYEQPAAGLVALPLLYAAAATGPRERVAHDALVATGAACAGAALYLLLFWATVAAGRRGTLATLPAPAMVPSEVARLAREATRRLLLLDFGSGALAAGAAALGAAPGRAALLAVAAVASAWLALRPGREHGPPGRARPGLVVAFGGAVFLACFLPALAARGTPVSARLTYAPSLCLALVAATALDGLAYGAAARRHRLRRAAAGAVAALAVLAACVAMVGVQASYRARTHADAALGRRLAETVREPPPGTLFVVLDDARRPVDTGAAALDGALTSVLLLPQAATPWVRWAYRRDDLFAAQPASWGVRITGADDRGVRIVGFEPAYAIGGQADAQGGVVLPWARLIALRIDHDGGVQVASAAELASFATREQ